MKERRPIDIKRESSGSFTIGNQEDGAIVEMFDFDGKLICIKERAIYEFMFADKIDPERTNINLQPNAIAVRNFKLQKKAHIFFLKLTLQN